MEPKKVLVPVDGSKADDEVIKLACSMTKKTKGKIYMIYVIEVKRTLPLEAEIEPEIQKGEKVLNRAERIAEEEDCEVETELLQAREAGSAIVDEAAERGVDLILMGMNYEKQFGEFTLGTILPYVLRNATCRVLICREPIY